MWPHLLTSRWNRSECKSRSPSGQQVATRRGLCLGLENDMNGFMNASSEVFVSLDTMPVDLYHRFTLSPDILFIEAEKSSAIGFAQILIDAF
jgi:hypothetical protein